MAKARVGVLVTKGMKEFMGAVGLVVRVSD